MSLTFEFLQLTQATFRLILSSCRCPRPDAEAGDSSEDGVGAIPCLPRDEALEHLFKACDHMSTNTPYQTSNDDLGFGIMDEECD